jgi:hypothetical protein
MKRGFVMVFLAIADADVIFPAFADEHIKNFRWYWFSRGVDIRRNGQVLNNRGIPQYDKTYDQVAREYGR